MTNEEVKVVLKSLADNPLLSAEHITKALYKAIELVETQPCEDCVSRQSVIELLDSIDHVPQWVFDRFAGLPSVTPSAQAWLSTFNTDSATECFTAVKELKRKIEKGESKNEN